MDLPQYGKKNSMTVHFHTFHCTSAELAIESDVTILGPGPTLLTVRTSSGTFRIFHIMPGHIVTIQGVTISFGDATFSQGGGILNDHANGDCFRLFLNRQ